MYKLYDSLVGTSCHLTEQELESYIDVLTPEQNEQLLLIILHYYTVNGGQLDIFTPENCSAKMRKNPLPYGMKIGHQKKGCLFNYTDLPNELKEKISLYIQKISS